jgi:copper homeostasis protein
MVQSCQLIGLFELQLAPSIPVFALIRPRRGDFLYSDSAVDAMVEDIAALYSAGADGFVFGALNPDGSVDEVACQRLVAAARRSNANTPCTFHRAFDVSSGNPALVLEQLRRLGFNRVLTSGRARSAKDGTGLLSSLMTSEVVVMPGCGVTPGNVAEIVSETGCDEVHASCRASVKSGMVYRNELCSMGGAGSDEYSRDVASVDVVKAMVAELARCALSA